MNRTTQAFSASATGINGQAHRPENADPGSFTIVSDRTDTAADRLCPRIIFISDSGTEELGHLEMIGAIVHQLTRDLTIDEIKAGGFDKYFVNHTVGVYPVDASGYPFNAAEFAVKGDPVTDLHEDMAAEQKARTTYDNILRLVDDPDVKDAIRFLREREIVHYQRFGESLQIVIDNLDRRNFYACNPSFDRS